MQEGPERGVVEQGRVLVFERLLDEDVDQVFSQCKGVLEAYCVLVVEEGELELELFPEDEVHDVHPL